MMLLIDVAVEFGPGANEAPPESKNPPSSAGGRNTTNRISPITGIDDSCHVELYGFLRKPLLQPTESYATN
jgi:hypothetical protein